MVTRLQRALVHARRKRDLSIGEATSLMRNVKWQTLANLERGHPQRGPANGGDVRLRTVISICEAYYPDVKLEHFGVPTSFQLKRQRRSAR